MTAKRTRRTRAASRQAILAAAEAIMLAEGPDAVRVQRVAAAVGVTDAAVHYHFGSRQGLIEALLRHSGRRLVREIAAAGAAGEDGRLDLTAVSRAMKAAYVDAGAGRMAMWLALAGWRPQGSGMLDGLIARAGDGEPTPETRHLIALLSAVHIAQAVVGEALMRSVGAPSDEAGQQAFLDFAVDLVRSRLDARG
jgi:AcrR family transcriptional regulator